jgi:phage terminase small subunit
LTVKQERFAHAYLECGNGSEAYRKAYDCKNMSNEAMKVEAYRLRKRPHIARRASLRVSQMTSPQLGAVTDG